MYTSLSWAEVITCTYRLHIDTKSSLTGGGGGGGLCFLFAQSRAWSQSTLMHNN